MDPDVLPLAFWDPRGRKSLFRKVHFPLLIAVFLLLGGCLGSSVRRELFVSPDFQPRQFQKLAVINLDSQVQFSEYVEAELLRRGYTLKEGSAVRQLLKKEGYSKEDSFTPEGLARIGTLLEVQGIVLCSVLEFSRFHDAYRLSMKMVNPQTGHTLWVAQGFLEGKKGEKSTDIIRSIVAASLQTLPRAR
jgi:hypothetical protein